MRVIYQTLLGQWKIAVIFSTEPGLNYSLYTVCHGNSNSSNPNVVKCSQRIISVHVNCDGSCNLTLEHALSPLDFRSVGMCEEYPALPPLQLWENPQQLRAQAKGSFITDIEKKLT